MSDFSKADWEAYQEFLNNNPAAASLSPADEIKSAQLRKEAQKYARGERPLVNAMEQEGDPARAVETAPKGHLEKTNLSAEQLADAIHFLEQALPAVESWILHNHVSTLEHVTLQGEIAELKGRLAEHDPQLTEQELEIFPGIIKDLEQFLQYEFSPNTLMYDLPKEIGRKLRIFKNQIQKKQPEVEKIKGDNFYS